MLQMFPMRKNFVTLLPMILIVAWSSGVRGADQIRVGYGSLSTSGFHREIRESFVEPLLLRLRSIRWFPTSNGDDTHSE